MHRIDGDGATVDNLFTEGNAALSVPATQVTAAIMNDFQEEIIKPIEAVGIPLAKGTRDQLFNAILEIHRRGGRPAPITQAIANAQASLAEVVGFPTLLTTEVVAYEFLYSVSRKTDSGNRFETGRFYATWDSVNETWKTSRDYKHDDAGVDFTPVATGEDDEYSLSYQSDNLAGTSYVGVVRITDIKMVRV